MRQALHFILTLTLLLSLCSCASLGQRETQLADILTVTGSEKIPQLEEYFRLWRQWESANAAKSLPAESIQPRPPCAAVLQYTGQQYDSTFHLLLQAMASPELTVHEKELLETLALCHLRNSLLNNIYRLMDTLRHGRVDAIRELQNCSEALERLCSSPVTGVVNGEMRAFSAQLSDWSLLLEQCLPLPPLAGLWQASSSGAIPDGENIRPVKFSALFNDSDEYAAAGEAEVWLHQFFPCPTVAQGRKICLLLPPLPPETRIFLNGSELAADVSGKCRLLSLQEAVNGRGREHLAIMVPAAHAGRAMLPPILVSTPE